MQHRTPSPNTQSGASVKIRAVFNVLSNFFLALTRVFHTRATPQKRRSRVATVE